MPTPLPLPLQTVYAELVERAWLDAAERDFAGDGAFVAKTVKGRRYWYWQHDDPAAPTGRRQRYVGPEAPELLERIARHRQARAEGKQRREMVAALRAAGLPGPDAMTGRVLAALEAAGAFRLRAVVVGTVAYQAYGGMLGERLGLAASRTGDLDLAQFADVSVAVEDRIDAPDMEAVLRGVDPRFRLLPAPPTTARPTDARSTRYGIGREYRVEVLTPNRGADAGGAATPLPALGAHGQPLRYLDFLIHGEVQAVALHGAGVPVCVPAPERYAVHKLIVSRIRPLRDAKIPKDLLQASELFVALARQRPYELVEAWREAQARGPKWRDHMALAQELLTPEARAALSSAFGTDLAGRATAEAWASATATASADLAEQAAAGDRASATVTTGPRPAGDEDAPDPNGLPAP